MWAIYRKGKPFRTSMRQAAEDNKQAIFRASPFPEKWP
jgi:hypothetical protein